MLYSVRSERLLMEQLDYNLLFRWFVGLSMDDEVWDASTFSKNRERLLEGDIAEAFFQGVLGEARAGELLSDEHFTVEGDVLIYSIGVFEGSSSLNRTPEEAGGPVLLSQLSEQTGGRLYTANKYELPDIAAKIGVEMRNRYVLGYSPTGLERDGRYHRVQVKVVAPHGLPPLKAFWRLGYYAPSE